MNIFPKLFKKMNFDFLKMENLAETGIWIALAIN